MSPKLHAEFVVCKDFPVQSKSEDLDIAIASALNMKRAKLAAALVQERAALGYTPSGVSAAEMRTRLEILMPQLDLQYDKHVAFEDCDSCGICVDYQLLIITMLGSGSKYPLLTRLKAKENISAMSNAEKLREGDGKIGGEIGVDEFDLFIA